MRAEKIADITLDWVENPNAEDGSGFYDPVYSTNKPTTRYFYDAFGQTLSILYRDETRVTFDQ